MATRKRSDVRGKQRDQTNWTETSQWGARTGYFPLEDSQRALQSQRRPVLELRRISVAARHGAIRAQHPSLSPPSAASEREQGVGNRAQDLRTRQGKLQIGGARALVPFNPGSPAFCRTGRRNSRVRRFGRRLFESGEECPARRKKPGPDPVIRPLRSVGLFHANGLVPHGLLNRPDFRLGDCAGGQADPGFKTTSRLAP